MLDKALHKKIQGIDASSSQMPSTAPPPAPSPMHPSQGPMIYAHAHMAHMHAAPLLMHGAPPGVLGAMEPGMGLGVPLVYLPPGYPVPQPPHQPHAR